VSLFAVGPTGVGKTKTAEALPAALKSLYQDAADFGALRLDMGEYQEAHRISQLLGSPQGYVGYGDGAQLVDALALNPRTIVLFDEIDKAHPDILRALMNAMDAGRLSSARPTATGREIDCRQAVFFFTSNFDAAGILKDLEERAAFAQPAVVDEVCRRRLRAAGVAPELVGRVGTFLAFRPLSPETRAEIVALAVATVGREYGVTVARIDPGVIVTVLASTQRQAFGARPDEYLVDELLGDAFARAAQLRHPGPFEILEGPPVVCVPAVVSSEGPRGAPSGGPSNGQQG
jgi:ATP-dependent Clp protease ATP-binding subunit ClpA